MHEIQKSEKICNETGNNKKKKKQKLQTNIIDSSSTYHSKMWPVHASLHRMPLLFNHVVFTSN